MAVTGTETRFPSGSLALSSQNENLFAMLLKFFGLMVLDAFALIIIYSLFRDADPWLAAVIVIVTLLANIVILVPSLYPIKWMAPGLMLVILLVLYPIIYTVVTAFTNYGDGHLLTKSQTVDLIQRRTFVSEDAPQYTWEVYQNEAGEYALWLVARRPNEDGEFETVWAKPGEPIEDIENPPEEAPSSYEGYVLLDRAGRAQALSRLQNTVFGEDEDTAAILSRNVVARPLQQRYVYDSATDTIYDAQDNITYVADNERGFFIPRGGSVASALAPGFRVNVGFENFARLIEDPRLRVPLINIFVWTVTFALLSVLTTFAMGLFIALVLNDPGIPGRPLIRSILIIPYAIPGVIGILIWRGLFNQELGLINNVLGPFSQPWFANPWLAKVTIILVNLWLGYPYMMLVCSGALQAIPSEVYEAAAVDGARPSQRFWRITLPLLLITVGPLLIASFVFNFNNYLMIEALTEGNPVVANSPVPAGHTDILISYTYGLAFGNARGADYGYASAITIIIFLVTAIIAMVQFRFTRVWEEVGENV